jgi:TP901 family phage tail tape measure protein
MPALKTQHSLLYKVLGAARVVAKNRQIQRSITGISMASTRLRQGLVGMRSSLAGAGAGLVALGFGFMSVLRQLERYTIMQSRVRTTLAAQGMQMRNVTGQVTSYAEAVGRRLGFSLEESNEGLLTMLQTGKSVHETMRLFPSTMRLARVADMEVATATRFLVDTTELFRREMLDTQYTADGTSETLRQFADRMSGQLAVAAYTTATNVEDLQQAFRYAGTEMSAMGYNSREVMSALAGLSTVGLRSTTAGTRLRGAMLAMHRTTGPLTEALRAQGIEASEIREAWYDTSGAIRPFYVGMQRMADITRRITSQQARNTIQMHLFGRRAFAGGMLVSGLTRASERARQAFEAMQDPQEMNNRIMAMQQERMRSFGMQMEQLRNGAGELAIGFGEILFGAMDRSGEGFGTYIRNLAEGVSVINDMNEGNEDARDRFRELNPQIQEQAREIHNLFTKTAQFLRTAGQVARHVAGFIRDHPYLVGGFIALRVAIGGPAMLRAMGWMITRLGILQTHLTVTRFAAQGAGRSLLGFAAAGAVIHVGGALSVGIQDIAARAMGAEDHMRELDEATNAWLGTTAGGIPIIGGWIQAFGRIVGLAREAHDITQEMDRRRTTHALTTALSSPEERISARSSLMRGHARWGMASDQERAHAAAIRESSESLQRFAVLAWNSGTREEEEIRNMLRRSGMRDDQLESSTRRIMELQESQSTRTLRQRGLELVGRERITRRGAETTRLAARQLAGLAHAAAAARAHIAAGNVVSGYQTGGGEAPLAGTIFGPPAEDAYIRQGGAISVSSGDVVISRRHLANAMTARAGAMAGPMPFEGERPMVGPSPSGAGGGGGGGTLAVPIVLQVDGREIARAVGRANIDQIQRGGGTFRPGDRRSIRETGFSRV